MVLVHRTVVWLVSTLCSVHVTRPFVWFKFSDARSSYHFDAPMPVQPPSLPDRAARLGWPLRGDLAFLNHGSFGSVPTPIQNAYDRHRQAVEADPIEVLGRQCEGLLAGVRRRVAEFVNADPDAIGLVTNASAGVGAVLRSVPLPAGARLVTTNHVYNAVRMAMRHRAVEVGGTVEEVHLPLRAVGPIDLSPLLDSIRRDDPPAVVIVDQITSPTAAVLDVRSVVAACRARGVAVLIDGAHAPGMLPMDLSSIDADWYTGNLHKWTCAPKGCGFLHASPRVRGITHPETISHNLGQGFEKEFGWQGTRDLAAWLTIPDALDLWDSIGTAAVRDHNHALCRAGKELLEQAWGVAPIQASTRDAMGSMAIISLPQRIRGPFENPDSLMVHLHDEHRVEVPVIDWEGQWHVRISAHLHNTIEDYERLAAAIGRALKALDATAASSPAPA